MSILCRFVEWYLDCADKPDRIPAFAQKHMKSCGRCRRQLSLSTEIRMMTKQACAQIPLEPFGGFKPLEVRPVLVAAPSGVVISPGLWVGSLVTAVVLAVVGTDYSHREIFNHQPMVSQNASIKQMAASSEPQTPLFSIEELKAFMPTQAETSVAAAQPKSHQRVAVVKPAITRRSGLVAVPVMPVRSRIHDRQMVASVQMLSGPSISEQQETLRTAPAPLTLRPSAAPTMAMMTKSVPVNLEATLGDQHTLSVGAGGGSAKSMARVNDTAVGSTAVSAVPMESRGIPTESELSL